MTAVSATPYLVKDKRGTAERIASAVELSPDEVERRLQGDGGYAMLNTGVDQQRAAYLRKLDLPGITLADAQKRLYPLGTVGAQMIGMTDDYGVGLTGLEKAMDAELKGTPGKRHEARDPNGATLRILDDTEPVPGETITLTIDSAIQQKVETVLEGVRLANNATAASAIVMRPQDGAVLAMATVPGYDPNTPETITPDTERMRPITDAYEPGSTFKLVSVAGAIEDGAVTRNTLFDLPPTLTLYDRTLHESHDRGSVAWTTQEILQNSSNIGTVKIAQTLGGAKVQDWIEKFGFGAKTGIDYPGEAAGIVVPRDRWSGTSILNIPIGQGVAVTLAQIAEAFGAIANGGRMVPPHLIKRVGAKVPTHPRGQQILSAKAAEQVNIMLQKVVSDDGTGAEAKIPGYSVGGKTGTANKIDPETGKYVEKYVASFVGYAPATHPGIVVAVMVDEPTNGSYYGGQVAAPAFEQIAAFALQHLHIAP
jgi:cell division protein FtsI/penicillin-binding protein 2